MYVGAIQKATNMENVQKKTAKPTALPDRGMPFATISNNGERLYTQAPGLN